MSLSRLAEVVRVLKRGKVKRLALFDELNGGGGAGRGWRRRPPIYSRTPFVFCKRGVFAVGWAFLLYNELPNQSPDVCEGY